MILAAGLGTRLRPLTNSTPKALIEVGGVPMLEHVARRLIRAGANRLIINVHHHADQIHAFLDEKDDFGVEVAISEEPERALETGGGLRKAAPLFGREAPFLIHNADILTDLDLQGLYRAHLAYGALATLAVRTAETDRYLLFAPSGDLCGYAVSGDEHLICEPDDPDRLERLDFCGVQAVSPRLFDLMTETGAFSIINTYLRLARSGEKIRPFRVDGAAWIDIGNLERLEEARQRYETDFAG